MQDLVILDLCPLLHDIILTQELLSCDRIKVPIHAQSHFTATFDELTILLNMVIIFKSKLSKVRLRTIDEFFRFDFVRLLAFGHVLVNYSSKSELIALTGSNLKHGLFLSIW